MAFLKQFAGTDLIKFFAKKLSADSYVVNLKRRPSDFDVISEIILEGLLEQNLLKKVADGHSNKTSLFRFIPGVKGSSL